MTRRPKMGVGTAPAATTAEPAEHLARRVIAPPAHPSGARPPAIPRELVPQHVAIVMDGNGRWANARGLPRKVGHEAGEAALLDVMAGAIEIGVKHVSVYAFSTENWKRSPDEVRFLMGFNRAVLHRQRDTMNDWGVRVRWAGRRPRLWRSVIPERHSRGRRPAQRTRTPQSFIVSRCRCSTARLKPIRKRTSSGERFQFSVENAYAEMCVTPISMAPATTSSSAASPAACPAVRGRPPALDKRPLTSITH